MGPQLSKPTPPTERRPSLELGESNEGGELAVARMLLLDGTRVYRIGVLSTRASLFFEGKISRMSSTTSWVRATYSCHHVRCPFRSTSMLHSIHIFSRIYPPICTPRLFPRAPIRRHVGHRASRS